MKTLGRKEVAEAVIIAGLSALVTGLVNFAFARLESYAQKKGGGSGHDSR